MGESRAMGLEGVEEPERGTVPEPGPGSVNRYDIATWVLAAVVLFMALKLRLLLALLCGMLVYELVKGLVSILRLGKLREHRATVAAVAVISTFLVALLSLAVFGVLAFLQSGAGSLPTLLKEMAVVLEMSRDILPEWLVTHLPDDVQEVKDQAAAWLRGNAVYLQVAGMEVMRFTAHAVIGLVIGAMVSLRKAVVRKNYRPLARSLAERVDHFGSAFHRIVFAQVRIAALNAFLTWLYLGVALPVAGVDMPLVKTLVVVTFVAGLLPVVGNLISNSVIIVVSLSWSVGLALASLIFLVVIHKLEYFLNAHIVGNRIGSSAWELLIAMLVMEAAFGIKGLIAAPIYYAYLKEELTARRLI